MFRVSHTSRRIVSLLLFRITTVTLLTAGLLSGGSAIYQLQSSQLAGSSSTPTTLFAAVSGSSSDPCTSASPCDLMTALTDADSSSTDVVIDLVTSGSPSSTANDYVGGFTLNNTNQISVTVQALSGVTPVLNGNHAATVLSVAGNVNLTIGGVSIVDGKAADGLTPSTVGNGGGIDDTSTGTLAIVNSVISSNAAGSSGGTVGGSGGGIFFSGSSLFITGSTVSNNSAGNSEGTGGSGGGIFMQGTSLAISNSSVSGNSAATGLNVGGSGGGILVKGGAVTVVDSTIAANSAGGGPQGGNGGGIEGDATEAIEITTSTLSGNSAGSGNLGGSGGAISIGGTSSLTVIGSTISGNSAGPGMFNNGVAASVSSPAKVTFAATVVANPQVSPNCSISGNISDLGYNVADDSTIYCGFTASTDVVDVPTFPASSPVDSLGPLSDNGGPTLTVAPLAGNPAIGLIPANTSITLSGSNVSLCPTSDQRGDTLSSGLPCNAGAVQVIPVLYATAMRTLSYACSHASPCSLATALSYATPGTTIDLVTPGSTASYVGNFTIATPNTTSTAPVTVQPATGVINATLDGASGGTVITVNAGVFATIFGVTIQNGSATDGGGIYNSGTLTATNDTISGNSVANGNGGGIYNSGTLTATNDTVSGNKAVNGNGGGFYNASGSITATSDTIEGNTASFAGGGIYNSGTLTATNDTISGNTAGGGGGGIANSYFGTLTATNDTISGNSGNSVGGGIANGGTLTATNDTITGNSASSAGGINAAGPSTLIIAASIVAGQTSGGNCNGAVTDAGYNLSNDSSCGIT